MPHKPPTDNVPWVATWEFPSFADADAFRALAVEMGFDAPLLRRKFAYEKQGAFPNWRTSKAIREAIGNRTFDHEMVSNALMAAGYAGTRSSAYSWCARAVKNGMIEAIPDGYRWLPPAGSPQAGGLHKTCQPNASNPCTLCQPEELHFP